MRRTHLAVLLGILTTGAAAAVFLQQGCSDSCNRVEDCEHGEVCYKGICTPNSSDYVHCDTDDSCGPSGLFSCKAGRCVLKQAMGARDAGSMDATTQDSGTPPMNDAGMPMDAGTSTATFSVTSPAFMQNGMFPDANTCKGADTQPALAWRNAPAGTRGFAVVLIDDTIDFVHWVAFDVPASATGFADSASDNGTLPAPTMEAMAFCQQYCGPCPPAMHNYTFRVYALDVPTIPFTASGQFGNLELMMAFGGHTLAIATLSGTAAP